MIHIAAIVLILGLCLPQALIAGEVLQAGEIDSSKVEVGAYAEVIYGTGERDQVSGEWKKLEEAQGYIKAVDQGSLTISQGLGKRIAFERIQQLILEESSFQMDRLKKTIDTLFVIETTETPSMRMEYMPGRIVSKLVGGVLCGGLFGFVGGLVTGKVSCKKSDSGEICGLLAFVVGGTIGYTVGVPFGVSVLDPHDQFMYSFAGSLIGGAAGIALTRAEEKLWPSLLICPLVGATILSELTRKPPEARRVSIGLLPGPKGRVSAVATLRF